MARIRFYPHNLGSQGCTRIAQELRRRGHNVLKVRPNGRYIPRQNDVLIGWGNNALPNWNRQTPRVFLNAPGHIGIAQDKLATYQRLQQMNISIPEFTADRATAETWLNEGTTVLERTMLRASEGRGINVREPGSRLGNAPLYVKYVKKMNEYRVHVFQGQVIDITEKRRRHDWDGDLADARIRNSANGYVFVREDMHQPDQQVLDQAIAAVRALGLDFGGVDVIWNRHHRRAYVLEVNTAPGAEGTTVSHYADAIEAIAAPNNPRHHIPTHEERRIAVQREAAQQRPRFNNNRERDNTEF